MPYVVAPVRVLGDVIAKFSALHATNFGRTYKNQKRDPSFHIKTPTCILYKELYEQKLYQKGLLIVLLEESHKEYLQVSLQAYSALTHCHEQKPQET
jgi:hypothetical protein